MGMALRKQLEDSSRRAARALSATDIATQVAKLRRLRIREADQEFIRTTRELKRVSRNLRDRLKST